MEFANVAKIFTHFDPTVSTKFEQPTNRRRKKVKDIILPKMLEKRTKGKATIGRSQKTHLLLGVAA